MQIKTIAKAAFVLFFFTGCAKAAPTAAPLPSSTPLPPGVSIRPADGMLMVQIPGGIPPGGSAPIESFWFDQTNVINSQFGKCVEAGACELSLLCTLSKPSEENPDWEKKTVSCARWSDEKTYCEWAGGRLPNAVEWEYAAQQLGEDLSAWGDTQFGFRCLVPTVKPSAYWPTQGWITSTPAEQGMDAQRVAAGIAQLETDFRNLDSLLIVRHGFLVVEKYYVDYGPTKSQGIASVNKSFLSALIGIAIEQGAIPGVDQKMMDYFPEYASTVDGDAYDITLDNLLTMTSGFYWPEDEPYPSFVENAFNSAAPQEALFQSPIIDKPGSRFNYCTACTHVLSIILQDATGMPAQDFAQKFLMDPIGISPESWYWNRNALGYNTGGWGFEMTPRDMAKFGYLYLNNGNWDGEQVIPAEWVRESRRSQIDLGDSPIPPFRNYGYGYLWWTTSLGGHPVYYALGHGGQFIYILPTLDMIVVITERMEINRFGDPAEIIKDYFAASILDQ